MFRELQRRLSIAASMAMSHMTKCGIFETIDMCEAACVGSVSSVLMTGSAEHMVYSLRSDGLSSKYESLSEAIVSAQLLRAGISDVCGE